MILNKPLIKLRDFSRRVAHEGIVILENNNNILPIINKKIAVFGRIQANYYKSGTGSGGLVNVTNVPSFINAFSENPRVDLNKDVLKMYNSWIIDNPFNEGSGKWASEPWSQDEMPISEELVKKYKRDDEIALVIIGRTAGEDRDNYLGEGSYLLTKKELNLIKTVKDVYGKIIVIFNTGNIMDLNFAKELNIDGLVLAWHGGQEGARATVDVITGYITPSGKLPSTIVKDLNKYPATKTFGNQKQVIYEEDIYVGYRFFETFMPEEVLYPFGYGLSYTTFNIEPLDVINDEQYINFKIKVLNNGKTAGKEVVQIYLNAPQGKLGKAKLVLAGFAKTNLLYPNDSEVLEIKIDLHKLASYDDSGYIKKSSYVLEKGEYKFFIGNSIKNIEESIVINLLNDKVVETLTENLAPVTYFERIKPLIDDDSFKISREKTPLKSTNTLEKIKKTIKESSFSDNNYKLSDVYHNKISLDEFVKTLTLNDLTEIILGEGMSSPKVTPGTASAFGGVTNSLLEKSIPIVCCADGPSGIRMDSGGIATSLPNGTLIASTFNLDLVEDLYALEGMEMLNYNIDILLGPGMNIQRHPLNGRNFEYFSEDPLLTGMMASSFIRGLNKVGVTGAMKHFIANNQETARTDADVVASERALREIYLKGYEIAVKESKASVIMTSYNPINGIWAASNYELNTEILRNEWGFDGIVMTDWWAKMNDYNEEGRKDNIAQLVRAQNDLYMVVLDATNYPNNAIKRYLNNELSLYELQRNAKNILKHIMRTPSFKRANNIKVEGLNRQIDYWFKYSKNNKDYPYLKDNRLLDGETTTAEKFLPEKIDNGIIERKGNVSYILLNEKNQTLYNYGIKVEVVKDIVDETIKKINSDKYNILPKKNFESIVLDLNNYAYKNDLANNTFKEIKKEAIYIYQVKVESFGKYAIEFEISSNQESVTQMPFSIYVDGINKQTLIPNGTNGNKITVISHVIIDNTNKFLSFRFNKTGLDIHSIKITRQG